jgi:hypothetical protein
MPTTNPLAGNRRRRFRPARAAMNVTPFNTIALTTTFL